MKRLKPGKNNTTATKGRTRRKKTKTDLNQELDRSNGLCATVWAFEKVHVVRWLNYEVE
jgi:hypothetical protein